MWWRAGAGTITPYRDADRACIQKFIHGQLPCNKCQHLHYKFTEPTCSNCKIEEEDDDHMIICQCDDRRQLREAWLDKLDTFLSLTHTPKAVKHLIMIRLTNWM